MAYFPIDFDAIRAGKVKVQDVADTLTVEDLRQATEFSVNAMLDHIAACADADVAFVARDLNAPELTGWTLSHVIAHTTATAEAGTFAAMDLARGITLQGIGRYETPWESLTTIEDCRHRLRESQRMRLASLAAWPDRPDLANRYTPFPDTGPLNAKGIFMLGLEHDDVHQRHLADIVRQIDAAHRRV
jgi:hypothetical protein